MTEQQYMQLMAQQRGSQQRQPSPQEQAMMMQQQQMQEGPGAAGGFMGGLLDSALIGLLPNSSYQNPNDPANVGASKMGGLIGMILPMLLAKYGAGKVLSSLASKEGMLANWMGKTAQGVERTTEQLGRADMLASVLGGGIGGGLAEGPVGGLLGAAGMGAYSKFAGAGAAMAPEETYAISKLFGGGKVKPPTKPLTKEQEIIKKNTEAGRVTVPDEELKVFKSDVTSAYDAKTGEVNLKPIVNYSRSGFDEHQFAVTKVGDKLEYITPRDLIENAASKGDEIVTVRKATQQEVKTTVNGKEKIDRTPKYGEEESKTWSQLLDEYVSPGKGKSQKTNKYGIIESKIYTAKNNPFKQGNGGYEHISALETRLATLHNLPMVPKDGVLYGGRAKFAQPKATKPTSGATVPDVGKLSANSKAVYDALLKKGVDPDEALEIAAEMTDKNLMAKAFSK